MGICQFVRFAFSAALAIALAPSATAAPLPQFSALYAFGDSLTDAGNGFRLTRVSGPVGDALPDFPVPPYFEGRFSNGYNFADAMSQRLLGVPTTPSLAPEGGTNYAVGGAMTGLGNLAWPVDGTGMLAQYAAWRTQAGAADPHALYLVFGGANDLFALTDALPTQDPATWQTLTEQAIDIATRNVATIASGLLDSGATHLLVLNLPDLGRTPTLAGTGLEAVASEATQAFNQSLDARLAALDGAGRIVRLDVYGLFTSAVTQPDLYGLTEVTQPCLLGGLSAGLAGDPLPAPCGNPDEYLFWDEMHPTARANAVLAGAALAALAIPEPPGEALLALVLVLGLVARRARTGKLAGRKKERQVSRDCVSLARE